MSLGISRVSQCDLWEKVSREIEISKSPSPELSLFAGEISPLNANYFSKEAPSDTSKPLLEVFLQAVSPIKSKELSLDRSEQDHDELLQKLLNDLLDPARFKEAKESIPVMAFQTKAYDPFQYLFLHREVKKDFFHFPYQVASKMSEEQKEKALETIRKFESLF